MEGLDVFDAAYTKRMLEMVAKEPQKYIHSGNQGDMFMWGGVWNHYKAEREIPYLKEFLKNCWRYSDNAKSVIVDFEHTLLIVNKEGSERSELYEFSLSEGDVVVQKALLELSWNQY